MLVMPSSCWRHVVCRRQRSKVDKGRVMARVAAAGMERRAQIRKTVALGQRTDVGSKGAKERETHDLSQGLGPGS